MTQDAKMDEEISQQNQSIPDDVRGDESPAFVVRKSEWIACNKYTDKLEYKGRAIGWTMDVENRGWFGRVKDERGEWTFGPSTRTRARNAAEAWIKHEPFVKRTGEGMMQKEIWLSL